MNTQTCLLAGLVTIAAAVALPSRGAGDEPKAPPAKGAESKVLEQRAGRWEYTGTVYPEALFPDAPKSDPIKIAGTLDAEFLPGGLWMVTKARGKAGDTPYEFMLITGYDAKKAKFTGVEVNSLVPPPFRIDEGTYDEKSKTLSWTGTTGVPGTDQLAATKTEDLVNDVNTVVSTGYLKRPGSDKFVKWYDFTQTRRKGP